jgi:hypothetical protein
MFNISLFFKVMVIDIHYSLFIIIIINRYRGFDRFYGYYGGSVGYYSKRDLTNSFDLHDDESVVTSEVEMSSHLSELLHLKAKEVIDKHAVLYHAENVPLFLYYSLPNGTPPPPHALMNTFCASLSPCLFYLKL